MNPKALTTNTRLGEHAVVIGAGMAGLAAARVLADRFEKVTIVDGDTFADQPVNRRAVPQGFHSHVLMANGRLIFERLFPGLDAQLDAAGVPLVDWANDCLIYSPAGLVPRFPSRLLTRTCTRPQLEFTVRGRVLQCPNIQLRPASTVSGLLQVEGRVTGVALGAENEPLRADFVVDASGRHSHAPQWLQALGYDAPRESVVNSFLGYATRLYERPSDAPTEWKGVLINTVPPQNPRAAGLWPIEGNRWLVTLAGIAKEYPPTDEAGFADFAGKLQSPIIRELIDRAKPLTPIQGYRRTDNQWRHYENVRLPKRFAVLGDGVCAFNPIYGQGMTVAAMETEVLERCLQRYTLDEASSRYHRQIPRIIRDAWVVATGEDSRWPSTEGAQRDPISRATHWYISHLMALTGTRPRLVNGFLSVIHMLERPSFLARPMIAGPVLFHALNPFKR